MPKYLGEKVVPNKSWFTVYELYNYTSPDFIHSSFNVNSSNYVQKLSNSYKFAYQIQVFHIKNYSYSINSSLTLPFSVSWQDRYGFLVGMLY